MDKVAFFIKIFLTQRTLNILSNKNFLHFGNYFLMFEYIFEMKKKQQRPLMKKKIGTFEKRKSFITLHFLIILFDRKEFFSFNWRGVSSIPVSFFFNVLM